MPVQIGNIKLFSLKDLAGPINVNILTLRRYINEGKFKGQKVGQKWYVTEQSLQEFFDKTPEERESQKREPGNKDECWD